jgi:hypothetical protein
MQYYFDIRDGDELMPDEEGLDLWSIDRVQQEAAKTLADLVKDAALELNSGSGPVRRLAVEVRRRTALCSELLSVEMGRDAALVGLMVELELTIRALNQ